jgi:fatty acid desaturase
LAGLSSAGRLAPESHKSEKETEMARKAKSHRQQKSVSDAEVARNWWVITAVFILVAVLGYIQSTKPGWGTWVICTGIAGAGAFFGLIMAVVFTQLATLKK